MKSCFTSHTGTSKKYYSTQKFQYFLSFILESETNLLISQSEIFQVCICNFDDYGLQINDNQKLSLRKIKHCETETLETRGVTS